MRAGCSKVMGGWVNIRSGWVYIKFGVVKLGVHETWIGLVRPVLVVYQVRSSQGWVWARVECFFQYASGYVMMRLRQGRPSPP